MANGGVGHTEHGSWLNSLFFKDPNIVALSKNPGLTMAVRRTAEFSISPRLRMPRLRLRVTTRDLAAALRMSQGELSVGPTLPLAAAVTAGRVAVSHAGSAPALIMRPAWRAPHFQID
jgi:hypothetical protein